MTKNSNYPTIRASDILLKESFSSPFDVSKNGGVITGDPIIANGTATFDGVSDKIEYQNDAFSLLSGGSPRTFRIWLNFTGAGGALSNLVQTSGSQEFSIQAIDLGATGQFLFSDGINAVNNVKWPAGTFPNDGEDHHLVMTLDDNDNYAFYLDSVSIKSGTFPISINTINVKKIQIGLRSAGGGDPYTGSFGEFLWVAREWSAQEVLDDYNDTTYTYPNKWILNLPIHDRIGSALPFTTTDISGNSYDATYGNGGGANEPTKLTYRNGASFSTDYLKGVALGISGDAEFTFWRWVRPSDITTSAGVFTIGNGGVALHAASLFVNSGTSGSISAEFAGGNTYRTAGDQFVAGEEMLIAVTKKAGAIDTTTKIYKNGIKLASATASTSTPDIEDIRYLVGAFQTSGNFFEGEDYGGGVANYPLTQTQIRDIYNKGSKYQGKF